MSRKRRKKQKTPSELGGPTPYKDAVRKAFGASAINSAEFLGMVKYQVGMLDRADKVHALGELEKKHLRLAVQEMEQAQRRVLAVGRKIQREP